MHQYGVLLKYLPLFRIRKFSLVVLLVKKLLIQDNSYNFQAKNVAERKFQTAAGEKFSHQHMSLKNKTLLSQEDAFETGRKHFLFKKNTNKAELKRFSQYSYKHQQKDLVNIYLYIYSHITINAFLFFLNVYVSKMIKDEYFLKTPS